MQFPGTITIVFGMTARQDAICLLMSRTKGLQKEGNQNAKLGRSSTDLSSSNQNGPVCTRPI